MDAVIGAPVAHGGFSDKCRRFIRPRHLGYQHRILRPSYNLLHAAIPTPSAASVSASSVDASCSSQNGGIARRPLAPSWHAPQLPSRIVTETMSNGTNSRNISVSSNRSSGTEPHQGSDSLAYEQSNSGGGDSGGGSNNGGSSGSNAGDGDRPYVLRLVLVFIGGAAVAVGTFLALAATGPVPSSNPPSGSPLDAEAGPTAISGVAVAEAAVGGSESVGASDDVSGMPDNGVLGNGPEQRLKRLLREAFADLAEVRLRLDALEARGAASMEAAAAGEALVVPLEGFAVRPMSRALAPGVRLRGNAQVSGTMEVPFLAQLAAGERRSSHSGLEAARRGGFSPELTEAADALGAAATAVTASVAADGSDSSQPDLFSWDALVAAAGLCPSPQLRLRIQSVWGQHHESDTTAGATAAAALAPLSRRGGEGAGSAAAGEEGRPVAAHLQLVTEPGGRHLEVDKLLLKAEAHPRLRLLLASRGSLENIGKNVNPFAAGLGQQRGLTAAMRRGHDLTLLSQGGSGAAMTAAAGDLSLAVGAFSGDLPALATAGAGDEAMASTAYIPATTTIAQLSLHRSRRLALSAIWSNSAAVWAPAAAAASSTPQEPFGFGAEAAEGLDGGIGGCPGRRVVQRGLVAAAQLTEQLTAAAWVGDSLVPFCTSGSGVGTINALIPGSIEGGSCRPSGYPWASATPQATQQQEQEHRVRCRERRIGLRLATLPDAETGRSIALCVSHRRHGEKPGAGTGLEYGVESGSMLMAELSAAVPLSHGVMLTPGLMLMRQHAGSTSGVGGGPSSGARRTMLLAAAQTTWSF